MTSSNIQASSLWTITASSKMSGAAYHYQPFLRSLIMFGKVKNYFTHEDKKLRDNRWIFASMLVGACLSLLAAFVLSVEAIEIAKNPDAKLSCSVNLIVNCATVAAHPTSTFLGFPNPFIGMMTEPIVITVAIAGL